MLSHFVLTIFSAFLLLFSQPICFSQGADPAGEFLRAYTEFQSAEQLESTGNYDQAIEKLRLAAELLRRISRESPEWQPLVVQYRMRKVTEALARVEASARAARTSRPQQRQEYLEGELPSDSAFFRTPDPIPSPRTFPSEPFQTPPPPAATNRELERLREENRQLREQLNRRNAELKSAMLEVDKTRVTVVELRHELAQTRAKLDKALRESTPSAEIQKEFSRKLAEVTAELEKTRAERDVLQEENDRLLQKLEQAANYIAKSDEIRKSLERERRTYFEERKSARAERDKVQAELSATLRELEDARGRLAEIELLTRENQKLKEQAAEASKKIEELSARVAEGDRALAELQQKLANAREPDPELVEKLAAAEKRIQELEAEQLRAAQLQARLTEAEAQLANQQISTPDFSTLQQDAARLTEQLALLELELKTRSSKIAELEFQLQKANDELARLKASPGSEADRQAIAENELLRSIILRELREQARRQQAMRLVEEELKRLKVDSESLRTGLQILGQGLQLTEEERALFRFPITLVEETSPEKLEANIAWANPSATPSPAEEVKNQGVGGIEVLPDAILRRASEAKQLFESGDASAAAKLYTELVSLAPRNYYLLSQLAACQFQAGQYAEAEATIRKAVEEKPDDAFSLSILGVIEFRKGNFTQAEAALEKALELEPNRARTHNYLGIVYSQNNKFEQAERHLQRAIQLEPRYAEAHFNLAVVYATQKPPFLELARKHYVTSLNLGAAPDPIMDKILRNLPNPTQTP